MTENRKHGWAFWTAAALIVAISPSDAHASDFSAFGRVAIAPAIIILIAPLALSLLTKAVVHATTKYRLQWWAVVAMTIGWMWLVIATRDWILFPLLHPGYRPYSP